MRSISNQGEAPGLEKIQENLERVRQRIRQVALNSGRDPDGIILVCVTKTAGAKTIAELIRMGVTDIGESRVQDAREKFAKIFQGQGNIRWHMVGHLQKNKARFAVRIFDMIHSVDSLQLVEELDAQAGLRGTKAGGRLDILLQVNTSLDLTKFGLEPKDVFELVKQAPNFRNINIRGLMTIAPIVKDPGDARPFFRKLKTLREEIMLRYKDIDMTYLSMGMSQDFEVAIQEGANIVRIGTAIVGRGAGHL